MATTAQQVFKVQPLHWEESFYLAHRVTVEVRGKMLTRYECFSRILADGREVRQIDTVAESEVKNVSPWN